MSGNLIAIIVILVLLLVLAGIIYYTYTKIRDRQYSEGSIWEINRFVDKRIKRI